MRHATIKNYEQAKAYLGNKSERPYAHNTRIQMDSLGLGHEVITVFYHGNPVVNFYPTMTSFNSCGWRTLTTKERINWFLPDGFYLYQEKSVWYIANRSQDKRYTFTDGLTIESNGVVSNAGNDDSDMETKKTIKRIKKFVDGYIKALLAGDVPAPSGGDCWYCYMVTDSDKSLGDVSHSDHIMSHLEESYFVPSMLMNAEKQNHRMCIVTKDGIARLWQGESINDWRKSVVARDVRSSLTAYIKHELNIPA